MESNKNSGNTSRGITLQRIQELEKAYNGLFPFIGFNSGVLPADDYCAQRCRVIREQIETLRKTL